MAPNSTVMAPYEFWISKPKIDNLTCVSVDDYDCLIVISPNISQVEIKKNSALKDFVEAIKYQKEGDDGFEESETCLTMKVAGREHVKRVVFVGTGPLDRHYDDVRRFTEAACKAMKRALKAGSKRPVLTILVPENVSGWSQKYEHYELASFLGMAEAVYVPLEVREAISQRAAKVEKLCLASPRISDFDVQKWSAIELGRLVARDIGGSDPERMNAPNVAAFVQEMFVNTPIQVEVIEDAGIIDKEYPLLGAVNRAAKGVRRHQARVIFLTYTPPEPVEKTIVLVGKGVTFDSGGADIKINGAMVGMHRDKCGAATVAGFMQAVALLRPPKTTVRAAMAMVRNSVGSDSYVADEIITSRWGVRVRVVNTDAEGRMAMADVLCHMKEKVLAEKLPNPHIFTIATLTGHAHLTVGEGYTIVMENGPAAEEKVAQQLQIAGNKVGDMFEISTIRREDYKMNIGRSEYEDLMQSSPQPSVRTQRGHQCPAAFLIMASGLDKHDINSSTPLKYCHMDIAGSEGPFPGSPSGAVIPALAAMYCPDSLMTSHQNHV